MGPLVRLLQKKGRAWPAVLLPLLLLALFAAPWQRPSPPIVLAAPHVFSGPVNGGCYLASATTCRLHVDNWQPISLSQSEGLVAFQLLAAGHLLYDFRTDASNPPLGSYLPSLVKQDFAARCGQSYVLTLRAQDTGDASPVTLGQTNAFTCPAAVPPVFAGWLPLVVK